MAGVQIDPEFSASLPQLSADELNTLEASIAADGIREPLIVWRGLLLDGHNRYSIAKRCGLKFETREVDLPDRQAALLWIFDNQLGRRNLHPNHYAYYRGKRYEAEKKLPNDGGKGTPRSVPQNDGRLSTSEKLAEKDGVSKATVERDAAFARGVDIAESVLPGSRDKILNGESDLTKGQVATLSKLGSHEEPEKLKERLTEHFSGEPKAESDLSKQLKGFGKPQPCPWQPYYFLIRVVDAWKAAKQLNPQPTAEVLARFFQEDLLGSAAWTSGDFQQAVKHFSDILTDVKPLIPRNNDKRKERPSRTH